MPLGFLGGGQYTAEIYTDEADADSISKNVGISIKQVMRSMVMKAKLAPGGGQAIRIYPVQ